MGESCSAGKPPAASVRCCPTGTHLGSSAGPELSLVAGQDTDVVLERACRDQAPNLSDTIRCLDDCIFGHEQLQGNQCRHLCTMSRFRMQGLG